MRVFYRIQQFWHHLHVDPLTEEAKQEVTAVLSPQEAQLFFQLSASDQWHSVQVLQTIQSAGYNDPDLWKAALLHDVGKSRLPLSMWDRVWIVLVGSRVGDRVNEWDEDDRSRWKRPFLVKAHHPQWGADMAAQAGSSPLTVSLIRRHQGRFQPKEDNLEDTLLTTLQWADDQN